MAENKMERLKTRYKKIQEKLQDRMDEFQDQVQNKIERSKLTRFISHLSDDRSSFDDNSETADKTSSEGDNTSIPSFVIDEPVDQDSKDVCKQFISIEQGNVLYKKSLSASNLATAYESTSHYSSSESCFSCLSSSDERIER